MQEKTIKQFQVLFFPVMECHNRQAQTLPLFTDFPFFNFLVSLLLISFVLSFPITFSSFLFFYNAFLVLPFVNCLLFFPLSTIFCSFLYKSFLVP